MSKNSDGFGSKYDGLSDDLKKVCDALLEEIDKHFDASNQGNARFANDQYRVWVKRVKRNFLIVEPKPKKSAIEVTIHAFKETLEKVPCFGQLKVVEKAHSSEKRNVEGPPVQHASIKSHDEIPCVIECAKAARDRWGMGSREV